MQTLKLTAPASKLARKGHPWFYADDIAEGGVGAAGLVRVATDAGRDLGIAFASPSSRLRLRLTVQEREFLVDDQRPQAVIGRSEESDLVVRGNLISRLHARIEFHRNRFMLTDQSTNGTFVQPDGQEEAFVRRDSIQLKGTGTIGLGRVPEADSPQTIHYVLEED